MKSAVSKLAVKPPGNLAVLVIFSVALAIIYSPTLIYPYLLLDETWIVRPDMYPATFPLGRPLFSGLIWLSGVSFQTIGLDTIYLMRGTAIAALAVTAYLFIRWFEIWGHDRWTGVGLALCVLTMPAYQIVVADGTQLSYGAMLTTFAVHLAYGTFGGRTGFRFVLAAVCLFCVLTIYQQQMLLAFALLAVPLLQRRHERETYRFILAAGLLFAWIPVIYFVIWVLSTWGVSDMRYGPAAVGMPDPAWVLAHFTQRFSQITNLWNVIGRPRFGAVALVVIALMLVKAIADFRHAPRPSMVNYALLLGLLFVCDGFVIVANSRGSYVTATALSFLITIWAFGGLTVLLGRWRPLAALSLASVGATLAFATVKSEIVIPNWRDFETIRAAIVNNPEKTNFHIVGVTLDFTGFREFGFKGFQEFSWRNATSDFYLDFVVADVVDDLVISGTITKARRREIRITIDGVDVRLRPEEISNTPLPESVFVTLRP